MVEELREILEHIEAEIKDLKDIVFMLNQRVASNNIRLENIENDKKRDR